MYGKKKPSGAEYKKRRQQKDEEIQKLVRPITSFLSPGLLRYRQYWMCSWKFSIQLLILYVESDNQNESSPIATNETPTNSESSDLLTASSSGASASVNVPSETTLTELQVNQCDDERMEVVPTSTSGTHFI